MKSKSNEPRTVMFVNTFDPVVPLFADAFPLLRERGWNPLALVCDLAYRTQGASTSVSALHAPVRVPRIFRRNRRWVALYYWMAAPLKLCSRRVSLIVFLTQPPVFYILGAMLARLRGVPYWIHVMDLYPDLMRKHRSSLVGLLMNPLSWAARHALRRAEHVIVLGRCMRGIVAEKGVTSERISIVENWPHREVEEFRHTGEILRSRWALSDRFVVMYAGNMGRFHSFDTILRVAVQLCTNRHIAFVFVGDGVRRPEVEGVARTSPNIWLQAPLRADEFADALAAADLHFVSLRQGFEGLVVPSKFYSLLASGKAILYEGDARGEVGRVIAEEHCGEVIRPGDIAALSRLLLDYQADRVKLAAAGESARRCYETRFRRATLANRYVDLFAAAE